MSVTLPLKWHGGKHYLVDWILEHRPDEYLTYCEPYFGGGQVLFRHDPKGHSEVINDINQELMVFWATLANPHNFKVFERLCAMTPFSQQMFDIACNPMFSAGSDHFDPLVVQAHQFFVRYRQSRQGLGKDFATISKGRTRRGMNEQVASWLGAIEGLPAAHTRLMRVFIFNDNALDVIKQTDHPKTWFYLDPTYMPETREVPQAYEHEMTYDDHVELLELLATIEGKFTLSGYESNLYTRVAHDLRWNCIQKAVPLHSSAKATKETKIECLWMNY